MNKLRLVLESPLFSLLLTLCAYGLAALLAKKWKHPLANTALIAVVLVSAVLLSLRLSYETYMGGGHYLSFLLQPATVLLALPLYRCLQLLRENLAAVLCGIFAGVLASVFSIWGFSLLLPIQHSIVLSLFPKSVTTPIALALCETLGGVSAVTATAVLLTGIFGAVVGPALCKLCKISDPVALGIALGTSCHAVGTARALELGEVEGAFSGMAIGIAGLTTVLAVPLILRLLSVI